VEIGRFIAQDNEAAAKRWVRKLRSTCTTTIGGTPGCGTRFDHLLLGMRCYCVKAYVIFFRGRDLVEILRIVQGSRDFNQLKFAE
jgi:plasmid stabilization system protein ParE